MVGFHANEVGNEHGRAIQVCTQNGLVARMQLCFDGKERGKFIDTVSQGLEPRKLDDSEAPGKEAWSPGPILRNKAFPGWALSMNRDIAAPIAWMSTKETQLNCSFSQQPCLTK